MQKRGVDTICYDYSSTSDTVLCSMIEDKLGRYELDVGLLAEGCKCWPHCLGHHNGQQFGVKLANSHKGHF